MGSPWAQRRRRRDLKEWLSDQRARWSELPRAARLNVALYVFTGLSMMALVLELLAGSGGVSSNLTSATPTSVQQEGTGTTLRDRRPGTTVIPTSTTTTMAPDTTLPPVTVAPVRTNTTRPIRRTPVTAAPAPAPTVAPEPASPPATEPSPTTSPPTTPTTVKRDPFVPEPPVLPSFPSP